MSEERLAALERLARPLAVANRLSFSTYHAQKNPPACLFDYIAIMVPAPALVASAVSSTAPGAIINIFAGIPATVSHPIDLQCLVERGAHFIGTSGSDLNDMKIVLRKVEALHPGYQPFRGRGERTRRGDRRHPGRGKTTDRRENPGLSVLPRPQADPAGGTRHDAAHRGCEIEERRVDPRGGSRVVETVRREVIMNQLANKVAVITGGAQGRGRAQRTARPRRLPGGHL